MYFGKFLEDLGIESRVSVRNENDLTILHVIPNCQDHALQEIHIALAAYLEIASDASTGIVSPITNSEADIKNLQLRAQIDHLNSQLRLEQAIAKTRETQVKLLEQYIEGLPNKSQEKIASNDINIEPLPGIKITKYKGSFFEIDVPRLANRIKNSIRKKSI
jgi:hypothetical protein